MGNSVELKAAKERLCSIIDGYTNFLGQHDNKGLAEYFGAKKEAVQRGRYQIALIGYVSRGKSTLLNALLGSSTLAPVRMEATTAAVVKYIDADQNPENKGKPEAIVRFDNENYERIETSEISRYVDMETRGFSMENARTIKHIEVYGNYPLIETRGVFVDTPGMGALQDQDYLAQEIMPEVDVILCPISVDNPLEDCEREFLAKLRKADTDKLMYVVTKIDDVDEDDDEQQEQLADIVAEVKKVAAAISKGGGAQIFQVAAKQVMDAYAEGKSYKDTEVINIKRQWGMQKLEDALDNKLRNKSTAADRIRATCKELEDHLANDLGRINESMEDFKLQSSELEEKKKKLEDAIQALKSTFGKNFKKLEREWKTAVGRFVTRLSSKAPSIENSLSVERENLLTLIGISSKMTRKVQSIIGGQIEPELEDLQSKLEDIVKKFADELEQDYNEDIAIYNRSYPKNNLGAELGTLVSGGLTGGGMAFGASLVNTGVTSITTALSGLASATGAATGAVANAGRMGAWFQGTFGFGQVTTAASAVPVAQSALLSSLATGIGPILVGAITVKLALQLGTNLAKNLATKNISKIVDEQLRDTGESIKKSSDEMLETVLSDFRGHLDTSLDKMTDDLDDTIEKVKKLGGEQQRKKLEQEQQKLQELSASLRSLSNDWGVGIS